MADIRDADAWIRRSSAVATVLISAAVIGIPYVCDRAYRRWWKENHPLAGHRARLERTRTGYQDRRADVTKVAQVISDVLVEVHRARSGSAR